ncbi:MAG: flagellar biosynthetic protein FliO [Lachnospiraceae bacterium]|nr:flagellar biosynthetic protein FliO [Lachnospiraceae bacterium]
MFLTVSAAVNSIAQFVTVLLIFLFVLVITYFTTRYIASIEKKRMVTGNMELLDALRISNNKYLQIVKVGSKYLCLAVCKDTVTMLVELEQEDIKEIESEIKPVNFQDILEKVKKKTGFMEKETNKENRP